VSLLATANDACTGAIAMANTRTGPGGDASGDYPLGTTMVGFTASDVSGNGTTCTTTVTVRDTTPPQVKLTLSP